MGRRRKPSPKMNTNICILKRDGWEVVDEAHRRGNAKGVLLRRGDETRFVSWNGSVHKIP